MKEQACTWGYGTFTVKGGQFAWTFTDGGSLPLPGPGYSYPMPIGVGGMPGEYLAFGWSLYRDVLTLTPVAGQVSPEILHVKPWRRVSLTPSAATSASIVRRRSLRCHGDLADTVRRRLWSAAAA